MGLFFERRAPAGGDPIADAVQVALARPPGAAAELAAEAQRRATSAKAAAAGPVVPKVASIAVGLGVTVLRAHPLPPHLRGVSGEKRANAHRALVSALVASLVVAACVPGAAFLTSAPPSGGDQTSPPSAPPSTSTYTPANADWVAALTNGTWLAGSTGAGTRITLPAGSVALSAANGQVLTAAFDQATDTSTIQVLAISDGHASLNVSVSGAVTDGVLTTSEAYVTGTSGSSNQLDLGLIAYALGDGKSVQLIPAGNMPAPAADSMPGYGTRGPVSGSPDGSAIGVQRCSDAEVCSVDVVDLASGHVTSIALPEGSFFLGLANGIVVARNQIQVWAIDASSGSVTWSKSFVQLAAPSAGCLFNQGIAVAYVMNDTTERLSLFDPASGAEQGHVDWTDGVDRAPLCQLSGESTIVLGRDGLDLGGALDQTQTPTVDVVDLTGWLSREASLVLP